jgi:hypothetical protein
MLDAQHVGKGLFGNPTRLRLALWVLRHDKQFFQSEPPRWVGVPNAIRQELDKLRDLGMIVRQRPPGENRVYYERTDSTLWEIIDVADRVLGRPGPSGTNPAVSPE